MSGLFLDEERSSWVISFSHFLPELQLMPEKRFLFTPNLTQIVGSDFIRKRVTALQPDLHVFGPLRLDCRRSQGFEQCCIAAA